MGNAGVQGQGGHRDASLPDSGIAHPLAERLELAVAQVGVTHPQQGGDRLLGRAGEVGVDHPREDVFPRLLGGSGGPVHVLRSVLAVVDQALLAEDPQHRADRRIGRLVRELAHDLAHGAVAATMEDLHHLPFASAQFLGAGLPGHRGLRIKVLLKNQHCGYLSTKAAPVKRWILGAGDLGLLAVRQVAVGK